jgi:diguanylate cyclase (GGDEF)-like protein
MGCRGGPHVDPDPPSSPTPARRGFGMSGVRARLLLLVGLAIGPLFLFTVSQGIEERRRAATRERAEARRLVLLFGAEHGRTVADARQILFVLAQAPAVRRANTAECTTLFRDVLAASPHYENLLVADESGVIAAAHPHDLDNEDRTLLARAAASTSAVGPIRLLGRALVPTISVAHAVPANGQAASTVLLVRQEMGWVDKEIAVAGLGPLTRVTLWDASGRILLRRPDPEGYLGRDASWSEVWKAMQATGGEGTAEAAGGDGVRRLYGFTRVGGEGNGADVFLSLGVPVDVAFADLRRLERRNLLVLALVTALAGGVTWLGGERLLVRLFGRMQTMADRDSLTGLANRRRLLAVGQEEQRRARRFGHPLAALMLDLDRFKLVNDRHGHGAGDDVLREVARRILATVRETDLPARYGGEEFAVLLPETDLETAREAAERIRLAVAEIPVSTRRGAVAVTLSAGVAVLGDETPDLGALFDAADAALYAAKAAGRNRVSVVPAPA